MQDLLIDLSKQEDLQHYLWANMSLSGTDLDTRKRFFVKACRWYSTLIGSGYTRLPFFVVHDAGALLHLGRNFPFRLVREGYRKDDPVRESYEISLGRLLTIKGFAELHDLVKDGSEELLTWLLERILRPLVKSDLPSVLTAAHMVRQVHSSFDISPGDQAEAFVGENGLQETFFTEICNSVSQTFSTVYIHDLIGEEDLFIARNFDLLGDRAKRLAAYQVAKLEVDLGPSPPPPRHWVKEAAQVAVNLEDAGFYPRGGLDELATKGSIENLVRSELLYMDDSVKGPDLFSLRFVEGELLYYTRDDGQLIRRYRDLTVLVDLRPEHFFRYPGQPVRFSSVLEAMVNMAIEELFEVFEGDAIHIQLLSTEVDQHRNLPEAWRVRFSHRLTKGDIDIGEVPELPSAIEEDQKKERSRARSVLYIGPDEAPSKKVRDNLARSGKSLVWLQIVPGKNGRFEPSVPDPHDWSFHLPLTVKDPIEVLRDLKKRVVWALFAT